MSENLDKETLHELHLLHFFVQRVLLLASHEAIINRSQYFFTLKSKCQLKVTGAFGWSSVEWGSLCSQNVFGLMLHKKIPSLVFELVVILNHLRACCHMNIFFCFRKNQRRI